MAQARCLCLHRHEPMTSLAPTTFLERIAVAWLDAATYSDRRANEVKEDNKNDFEFWDHRADRYDAMGKAVCALPPATPYKSLVSA